MKKNKIIVLVLALSLLAVGCDPFSSPVSAGVVKTVNGGSDWQFSNLLKGGGGNLSQSNITKLAFDPQNREVVYAGSSTDGLFKSEDSGASWTRVLSKISVNDFVVSPTDSKTIFVAGIFSGQGKVLKTTDGGASWQEVYNEATASNAVRAIDINPASVTQVIIGTASGNLIKSADGGLSWQLAVNFNDQINQIIWRPSGIYILLNTKGLQRGTNAATDFQVLTANAIKAPAEFVWNTPPATFNQAYVDSVSSSLFYVTTNRGLYKSTDGGKTWVDLPLPIKQIDSNPRPISVAQTSSNVVFTAVGAVIYKSTNGGSTWQTQTVATTGFIDYILIDPQLPQIDYAGTYMPAQ